jgi:hypothetical protein
MNSAVLLALTDRLLATCSPAAFDYPYTFGYAEVSEACRHVEDEGAWEGVYSSLEAFYAAHENRHPNIRLYAQDVRRIEASDPFKNPWGGLPSERLARLRGEIDSG